MLCNVPVGLFLRHFSALFPNLYLLFLVRDEFHTGCACSKIGLTCIVYTFEYPVSFIGFCGHSLSIENYW